MRKRHFTLAQANTLISRVRPRIERLMQLSVQLHASEASARGAHPALTVMAEPSSADPSLMMTDPSLADASDDDGQSTDDLMRSADDVTQPVDAPLLLDPAVGAFQGSSFPATDLRSADEDADKRRALTACLYALISDELRDIERLGAEVKELGIGLTVFPSFLEGSVEVLLAWTVADAEIRTFFTPQGGYRTRKPVEGCRFTDGRTPTGQLRE